ncbi:MAG: trypsin-like peptidase domain-containing protein [Actinobacteria bacterium]|nr:trypsin-like peptidase domain-containing protein [Actinomycetota bacterium]HRY09602.1 trypsin-like peptidase domain-containing protein [Candidatus Nanopelagicales bacterium]
MYAVLRPLAALLACGFAVSTSPAAAEPPPVAPLEQVQALVQPAVVYEQITWTGYVYDETNKGYFTQEPFVTSFQCTGFVVNPDGYIATAGHCVDYDSTVREAILTQVVEWAYVNDYYEAQPSMETIATFARNWRIDGATSEGTADLDVAVAYGVTVSGEPSGKALPARVLDVRSADEGDVALLKIEAENLTVLPLSDNTTTGVGTEVVSVGYPASVDLVTDASFNPSFKEGTISAEKTTAGGLLPVYEISAAVSGGMSGGPTVGLEGDVIGVNSFGIEGETQPFNFVQPASNVDELLRAEGVDNTLGTVTQEYRAGLNAYFAGDREAAIENFEAVLDTVPSHQFAQDYLQKAQDLPSANPVVRLWWLWLLILLAALVAVGVLIWTLQRRSKAPAPAAAPAAEPVPTVTTDSTTPDAEAVADQEVDLFCPNCGRSHTADDHFCAHCGHRFE